MYFKKLKTVGGTPDYSFELISGHFPPVLGISPAGEIIGHIPKNTKGTWTFKVKVTDSKNNSISETVEFTVIPTKTETKKPIVKKESQKPAISYDFNLTKLRQMEKNLANFYPQLEKNGITLKKVKISKFTSEKVKIQYYQSLKKLSDIQKGYNMSDNGDESIKELSKKIQEHQTETQDLYNYFQQMEKLNRI
jgi:predicted RNase H-like nuclease (RuvC/YqgF family)